MPAAKSLKVLVVDDQQTMRGLARQALKHIGVVDVSLAATGEGALDVMNTKMFDVVISDLNMPGLSGLDLARKIKSHPVFNRIPVFLATSDAYRDQATADLVDQFVAKPFSAADMRQALEAHLGALS
ncbi:response regulator [Oceanicella sp. SM1341]|uniref:response regulator n=1 Tax=Oceanicella sp. SM1341 TaxID=1548889 RepID=UPI000E489357|nr:response regulator [Oceanicella sp. SM1341]